MRLAAYTGVSVALAGGVVLKALHQRANFYSACVYLSQSNANLMILTNLCLLIVGFVLFGLQRILYGRLRPIETEQLYEKAWFAVTETCLAMTIFRGELGGWFLVMFVCLLVGKVWGWIGEGRVEILEQQPPSNPRLFHTRLAASLILSVLFNAFMLEYAVKIVLRQARPDMMVMFGFEFAVLTILSISTAARYAISLADLYITRQQRQVKMEEQRAIVRAQRAEALREREASGSEQPAADLPAEEDINEMELDIPGWEEKGRWVFYLDLLTDFCKLVVYLAFFAILFTFYGLPIHILRDVVLTMRSFGKRIADFLRYRNATRDMNERYADATAEEIGAEDVCIICREEMRPWQPQAAADGAAPGARPAATVSDRLRPKKLPCGHILHFACLRSWLERQQNCPTCRRPVASAVPRRTFQGQPGVPEGREGQAAAAAQPQAQGANQPAGANAAPPAEGRPRAWVLNFGPVRIGFGAGRGDLLQNIANQVQAPGAQRPQVPNQNVDVAPAGAQQVGFGFGFGRPPAPAAQPTPQFNHQSVQAQLQQMEQQIMQEINSLRVTAEQVQVVRLCQSELARLRALQANPATQATAPQTTNTAQPTLGNVAVPTTTAATSAHGASTGAHRHFTSNPQQPALVAGDARLPEGLTLPQGWTLLPLQPQQQHHHHQIPNISTPPPPANSSSPFQPPTPPATAPLSQLFPQPPAPLQNDPNTARANGIPSNPPTPTTTDHPSPSSSSIFAPPPPQPPARSESPRAPDIQMIHRPPNWGTPTPLSSSHDQAASNGQTQAQSGPSSLTALDTESSSESEDDDASETQPSSLSKGKSRAATVEDEYDEDP
ncbi:hypothetical protein AJ80_05202 [Polytolypa hystricis UAMH7299]|uniref:RING-type E3 ubiquitin transferase n=1 Tax=Polytolypa hystricis (strain UAMH7299) TaxID=1447883 RepID=A0A2B7Y5P4_POLH7|nr:hypothetical protein AJ80_05202 [Polytolypa hystricis UAMH7299]